ncbi:MAG: NPCBM/NEW2 domain-containing protein [Verrucomicrobia bacterium]|nr:NPCBM/NEW2 domain-containing protein [Verrucomicrobiota bacterium]
MEPDAVYLDSLPLISHTVGYGTLGTAGQLGYENKMVSVRDHCYDHAFSAHPPARLRFQLDGRFRGFRCGVGVNDDVPSGRSHADFIVLADGRQVAAANFVAAEEGARALCAEITGAQVLELVTHTTRWEYSHAVWLDPQVTGIAPSRGLTTGVLVDCLQRAELSVPSKPLSAERCLATVVSPGFTELLDDMLGSLYANGCCQDALVVIFAINPDEACAATAAKYRAQLVHCRALRAVNATSKALLYSAALAIDSRLFLCLDADMLVLGDLRPVFAALEACPEGAILACREGNGCGWHNFTNLNHALCSVYGGRESDWCKFRGVAGGEGTYTLVVNDGLFAGSRAALLALDGVIRAMNGAPAWIDERHDIWWRNQFVFNLALARLGCGMELDGIYNVQLNSHDVEFSDEDGHLQAIWGNRPARLVHFNGLGRKKYPEWRNRYACIPDPMVETTARGHYEDFLTALRAWIGRYGLKALAWSFCGTSDAHTGKVFDHSGFPLFALLHYVIRANGCVRVLETGTARGVSAACLASAVAHRPSSQVVTFDPFPHPERIPLWAALPAAVRACIEQRSVDSLEGMAAALQAGEQYQGALLDSIHTEEHVWAEFQLAVQLVCRSGLILIHDSCYAGGTVEKALRRIESAGYNVSRLWAAESGVTEDDHLGLALVVNSRRAA